jgi:DNA-directed RNA polymerase subunit RPC12/RpoP
MNLNSVYKFSCLCGREFQTKEKGTIECPDCHRILMVQWRDDSPGLHSHSPLTPP